MEAIPADAIATLHAGRTGERGIFYHACLCPRILTVSLRRHGSTGDARDMNVQDQESASGANMQ